jgi:capsule polysaccharide export protein KpsE/RkpR
MLSALMAMNSNSQVSPTAKAAPDLSLLASEALGMKSTGALFVGILRSQTVEDRLVDRFNLRKVYSVSYLQDARKKLEQRTTITEDRKSGIISITVSDSDPKRAAALAQANVEELDALVAQLSTSSAHRERVFLEERLADVKNDLEQVAQRFSQFSSRNMTIDLKDEARAVLENSAGIEGQLIASESELKGLKTIYGDENVRVRTTQARINELRRQLEKLGGPQNAEGDPSATTPNGSALPTIRNLPLLGATYADLYRRVQLEEVVFQALTQQYELVKVQEAKETPSVKVLDPANIPERRSFPPRLLIIFSFGFLALMGGVFYLHAGQRWAELDANDPGKAFLGEVLEKVNARMPWMRPDGSRFQQVAHWVWVKLTPRQSTKNADERT